MKKVTLLTRLETAIKKRSNARPKSLVLYIPATVRDVMGWEHDTPVVMDICVENDCRILKIYTKLD